MRIQNTPFGSNSFKRGVAIITVALFLLTSLSSYAPAAFAQPVNLKVQGGNPSGHLHRLGSDREILIPPELGLIDESFHGTSGKTILFIQDAHDSLEAQENIAKIINNLVLNYGVKTVFEEGYEGPVPTDKYFGFIKEPKIKEKVSYFLMDHLRVGGAEYAHINRTKDFNLVGADSLKLHKENVDQYRFSATKKDAITKDLKMLEKELKSLTDSRFPKELKGWLKTKEQFDAKKLDLFTYLGRTMPLLGKHGAEKGLGLISFILEAIRSNDPAVIEKAKHIDAREVFSELIKLEQEVAETYLHNTADKQLFEYYKIISLLNRLNDLQVSQEEYEAVKASLKTFDTDSFARFIFRQVPKTLIISRMWERNIKDAIRFYEIAQERDHALSQVLDGYSKGENKKEALTRKTDVSVLVFGGFHKESIKRILEAKGISYLVVSPRITKPSPRHEEFYKQLMTKGMYKFEVPLNLRFASRALPVFAFANGGDEVRAIDNVIERGVEPAMVERYLFNTSTNSQDRSEVRAENANEGLRTINRSRPPNRRVQPFAEKIPWKMVLLPLMIGTMFAGDAIDQSLHPVHTPPAITVTTSQVTKVRNVSDLVNIQLAAGQDWQFFNIMGTEIYHVECASSRIENEIFLRLSAFTEDDRYAGQIVSETVLENLTAGSGYDFDMRDIARFYTQAAKKEIPLKPAEIKFREDLLILGFLAQQNGQYRATKSIAVISASQDAVPRFGKAFREDIIHHEWRHGLFFAQPEIEQEVMSVWKDELSERQRAILGQALWQLSDYNRKDPRILATELHANWFDRSSKLYHLLGDKISMPDGQWTSIEEMTELDNVLSHKVAPRLTAIELGFEQRRTFSLELPRIAEEILKNVTLPKTGDGPQGDGAKNKDSDSQSKKDVRSRSEVRSNSEEYQEFLNNIRGTGMFGEETGLAEKISHAVHLEDLVPEIRRIQTPKGMTRVEISPAKAHEPLSGFFTSGFDFVNPTYWQLHHPNYGLLLKRMKRPLRTSALIQQSYNRIHALEKLTKEDARKLEFRLRRYYEASAIFSFQWHEIQRLLPAEKDSLVGNIFREQNLTSLHIAFIYFINMMNEAQEIENLLKEKQITEGLSFFPTLEKIRRDSRFKAWLDYAKQFPFELEDDLPDGKPGSRYHYMGGMRDVLWRGHDQSARSDEDWRAFERGLFWFAVNNELNPFLEQIERQKRDLNQEPSDRSHPYTRQINDRYGELHRRLTANRDKLDRAEAFRALEAKTKPNDSSAWISLIPRFEDSLCELEFALAGLRMLRTGRYTIPEDGSEIGEVVLKGLYNPVAGTPETLDTLDVRLSKEENLLAVTGPNEIGKSTLIDAVVMAILYRQMGLPIPAAAGSRLSIFRNIYTVTPGFQTSSGQGDSRHTGFVRELQAIIKKAQLGDLVVIDDAHMGSEYADLVAINAVLLEDLRKTGATILYATHLKDAVRVLIEQGAHGIQAKHMTLKRSPEQKRSVRVLEDGVARQSFAFHTFKKAGMPSRVLRNAATYYKKMLAEQGTEARRITLSAAPHPQKESPKHQKKNASAEMDILQQLFGLNLFGRARSEEPNEEEPAPPKRHIQFRERVDEGAQDVARALEIFFPHDLFYFRQQTEFRDKKQAKRFLRWLQMDETVLTQWKSALFDRIRNLDAWFQSPTPDIPAIVENLNQDAAARIKTLREIMKAGLLSTNHFKQWREAIEADFKQAITSLGEITKEAKSDQPNDPAMKRRIQSTIQTFYFNHMNEFFYHELDFYLGMALSARRNHLAMAERISSEEGFSIHDAYSPFVPGWVPVELETQTHHPQFAILGANKSGKTEFIRLLRLIVELDRRDLPVPARATLPRYSKILSFFGDEDDPSSGESYLRAVAERLVGLLQNATPGSLVIMDEIHGSDYWELSAIQAALIRELDRIGCTVILNTHMKEGLKTALSDLKHLKILKTRVSRGEDGKLFFHYGVEPVTAEQIDTVRSYGIESIRDLLTEDQWQRALAVRDKITSGAFSKATRSEMRSTLEQLAATDDKDEAVVIARGLGLDLRASQYGMLHPLHVGLLTAMHDRVISRSDSEPKIAVDGAGGVDLTTVILATGASEIYKVDSEKTFRLDHWLENWNRIEKMGNSFEGSYTANYTALKFVNGHGGSSRNGFFSKEAKLVAELKALGVRKEDVWTETEVVSKKEWIDRDNPQGERTFLRILKFRWSPTGTKADKRLYVVHFIEGDITQAETFSGRLGFLKGKVDFYYQRAGFGAARQSANYMPAVFEMLKTGAFLFVDPHYQENLGENSKVKTMDLPVVLNGANLAYQNIELGDEIEAWRVAILKYLSRQKQILTGDYGYGWDLKIFQKIERSEVRSSGKPRDVFAAFGIRVEGDQVDYSQVPHQVDWIMDGLREKTDAPVIDDIKHIPTVSLFGNSRKRDFPSLPRKGGSSWLYLVLMQENGKMIPAVLKSFDAVTVMSQSRILTDELIAAQLLDRAGVGPRFYGVVRNESGEINGYVMQLALGETRQLREEMDVPFKQREIYREIKKRSDELSFETSIDFIITRTGGLVSIDAGDVTLRGPRSEVRARTKGQSLVVFTQGSKTSVEAVAATVTLKTEKKTPDFSDFQDRWIVLADDKPYILKGYEQILREQGFRNILTASSPKEALNHVTGMLKQGVASDKIVVITDYQFQGKDTALDLINNLRVPNQGKVFRGPILVVSGSIVSRHEMPGYANGHLDSVMARAYGLGYLEKNGSFYFRENFLNELRRLLKEPPNPAMFSKKKLALGKKEETKLPQQLVYLEGAINDWENATGNALRELGDLLSKENLAGGDRSAMEADLRAILGLIEFGRIPKDRNFEGRIHDYKSALHQALAIHIRSLQDRVDKIQGMNDSKTFSRSLDQLENALKGAFQNAYFLHQLFYLTRVLGRAGMWEPLLKQAIIEYQVRYEGKKDTQWDSESGIAQAWKEFERLRPGIEKAEIEQAIRDWGRLRNDYKAVQAELGSFIRERVGERGTAFLEMMSLNLNRFFTLYLRQYGVSGLQAVHPGRAAGKIKILRGTEDEIRQSLEGLEAGRIVVLDQDYSTLSAAGTAQTGMVFSREGAGHLATRARALGIPLVYFPDAIEMLEEGMDAILTSENGQGAILPATREEAAFAPALKKSDRHVQPAPINENVEPVLHLYGVMNSGTYDKSSREEVFADLGPKAGRLALMYRDQEKSSALVPGSLFLTFGFWKSLRETNPDKAVAIASLQKKIALEMEETRPDLTRVRGMLEEIRNLVQDMRIPENTRHEILTFRQQEEPDYLTNRPGYKPYVPALIIRAASNVQDLENDAGVGAGVEDSNEVPETLSQDEYEKLVLKTLAGFWKWEAYADRRQWGISEEDARPALMIQEHVGDAESYAALIHTADPKSQDAGVVMIEFIPGSGRTLTDPAPKLQGEPFRYYFDKKTGEVITKDDSREAFRPILATKKYTINSVTGEIMPLDYRHHKDIATEEGRIALVRKIGMEVQKIEQYWGRPMDIEMVISKTNPVVPGHPDYDPSAFVYMPYTVQARPQAHFEPFAGSYQFDLEEKSRVEYWRKWIKKYGAKNIQDRGFLNDAHQEKLSGRMIPEAPETGGAFLDSIGDYRSRPGLLRTLLTNPEFERVREGVLRRSFFYAKYSHQVLQNLLENILKNDPELFRKIFVYAISPFRFGEHLKQYPDSLAFFRNVNDFLLPRFSVGKIDAMIDAAQDLPSLSLVDLANQMDYGNQYGMSSASFVRDECLKILAGRKDVAQVRDLLDPGLQDALGRVVVVRSEMRVSDDRAEARVQSIAPIMNKAVLVIEQATIDMMTAVDFKKLLCLAGIKRSEIRLVIPDVLRGQYSNRVAALRSVATVDVRLPEMVRSGKIPVFGFSDMERDTAGAFKARLGKAEPRIASHLQECFALDGMDGIVLALLVNRPEDLRMKNGFRYDGTGRFRSEVHAFVEALIQNFVVVSTAA